MSVWNPVSSCQRGRLVKYSTSCPKFSPVWTSCRSMHHLINLFPVARCRDRRKCSPPPRQHSQEHRLRHPFCSEKGYWSPCLCLKMQFPRKLEAALLAPSLNYVCIRSLLITPIATTTLISCLACCNSLLTSILASPEPPQSSQHCRHRSDDRITLLKTF